jgi:hypothetical protein
VHDELDIPPGELRVKLGGGSAGHNGLRSLTQALRTPDYLRVRIGIGRPPGRQDPADFVLEPIGKRDEAEIAGWVDRAADAVRSLIAAGLAATQDRFNWGRRPHLILRASASPGRRSYPVIGTGAVGNATVARCGDTLLGRCCTRTSEGGDRMRAKMHWRHLLYTGATLATLLLAAGARWRPN